MISLHKNLSTLFYFLVNRSSKIYRTVVTVAQTRSCLLCEEQTINTVKLCTGCLNDLPWNKSHCTLCALPLYSEKDFAGNENGADTFASRRIICGECMTKPPPFSKTIATFIYQFPVDRTIQQVKYHRKRFWLNSYSYLLRESVERAYLNSDTGYPELIIPIPLHHKKRNIRGYNQSEIIARHISKSLKLPLDTKTLVKTRSTEAQAGLNKTDRMRNLKDAFKLRNNEEVKGKYIAVIDDVMTTKATAELASELLLARTPKHQ